MKKPGKKIEEVHYWEAMADSLVALLLCVLLVVALLVFYLVRIPDSENVDTEYGDRYEETTAYDDGGGGYVSGAVDNTAGDGWEDTDAHDAGNNEAGTTETETTTVEEEDGYHSEFEDPDPGAGLGEGTDKASVLVQVVDGETGRTVKQEGIKFELYDRDSQLQILSTYYPEKTEFSVFETDQNGEFYLPEKIMLSTYYLQELTAVSGYDLADRTEFEVKTTTDWADPLLVTIPIYPARNSLRVQLVDEESGKALSGATFDVVASGDIITKDGTVRYKSGDVVDTIVLDEDGYGESIQLFLGTYLLRQKTVPEYYAKIKNESSVEVYSKNSAEAQDVTEISEGRTAINVTVVDALYDSVRLEGTEFKLLTDAGETLQTFSSDASGSFTVKDLEKNTTYHLQQISALEGYEMDRSDHEISVSEDGLIEGDAEVNITIRNSTVRISVGVHDMLFRGQVSDVNMALCDAENNVIKIWNSTGVEEVITGLEPGEYRIIMAGNDSQAAAIMVEKTSQLQEYNFSYLSTTDLATIAALAIVILGAAVIINIVLRRRKRNRKKEEE